MRHSDTQTTENTAFTRRFRDLIQPGETHEAFAKKIGVERNTITQYFNGNRIPTSAILFQICKNCNVSADWLLGLSDVKSPDANAKAACEYTGLSEKAIEYLHEVRTEKLYAGTGLETEAKTAINTVLDTILSCQPEYINALAIVVDAYFLNRLVYPNTLDSSNEDNLFFRLNFKENHVDISPKQDRDFLLYVTSQRLTDLLRNCQPEQI